MTPCAIIPSFGPCCCCGMASGDVDGGADCGVDVDGEASDGAGCCVGT